MSLILSWIGRPAPRREEAIAVIRAFVSTLARLDGQDGPEERA